MSEHCVGVISVLITLSTISKTIKIAKEEVSFKKSILGTVGISIAGTGISANSGWTEKVSGNTLRPGQLLDAAPFSLFTSDVDGKAHSLRCVSY